MIALAQRWAAAARGEKNRLTDPESAGRQPGRREECIRVDREAQSAPA